jgi:stearoyl-CoA desaturase (delta-9 desaturase)
MASVTETKNKSRRQSKKFAEALAEPGQNLDTDAPLTESLDPSHDDHDHHDDEHNHSWKHKAAVLGAVVFPLLGMIAAIIMAWQYGMMNWINLTMLIGGWYLTGMGITIGFHRMLTHRSFEAKPSVYKFWTVLGSLAVEGSPIDWCMVHRKHHQFSDHEGDPHSPHLHGEGIWNSIKGFYHSHTGWMFQNNWSRKERKKYVPDLMDEPLLKAIDDKYYWWVTATLVIPLVLGGLAALFYEPTLMGVLKGAGLGFLWGGLARVCLSHHMTWSINSICHIIGSQDYKSSDDSKNNLFFGVLSHGEGWHNNHHAFPTSARHGLKWWQFDLSWVIIRTMAMCGLVWNVKLPTERQLESRAIKQS